jgi:hypothetical protein
VARCMVADKGDQAGNCDEPATHYAVSNFEDQSVFIPLCERHVAELTRSSPDVVRAITEARGPR